jgi:hypothetical protein
MQELGAGLLMESVQALRHQHQHGPVQHFGAGPTKNLLGLRIELDDQSVRIGFHQGVERGLQHASEELLQVGRRSAVLSLAGQTFARQLWLAFLWHLRSHHV